MFCLALFLESLILKLYLFKHWIFQSVVLGSLNRLTTDIYMKSYLLVRSVTNVLKLHRIV